MKKPNIIFDVEADGPCPGIYSMISLGACTLDRKKKFYAEFHPITDNYIPGALEVSNFTREQTLTFPAASQGFADFIDWVKDISNGHRPMMWSDNPAFDWQWINYYFFYYNLGDRNPLGHSCRRIGDLAAGLKAKPNDQSSWKKLRKTRHTHNALDDAVGNAEALEQILNIKHL